MKHRKDKFLLGVFLGILMVTMQFFPGAVQRQSQNLTQVQENISYIT